MNTKTPFHPSPIADHALPRTSLVITIAVAIYVGLVVGTHWTLFEAPPLPEAVAASYSAPQRCASGPQFALPCQDRDSPPILIATIHS